MDYYERKMDHLPGPEFNKPVGADHVRFSKVDITSVDNRIKISVLIKLELPLKIHIKILDRNSNLALAAPQPMHNLLVRLNQQVLISRKVQHE